MFFQEAPSNTTTYMIAGYIIIFGVMLLYIISLYLRNRNLERDLDVLQEIETEE
jgi:hypothetical protein